MIAQPAAPAEKHPRGLYVLSQAGAGPAEVIVLAATKIQEPTRATSAERHRLLEVIQDLKSTHLTSEEELLLEEFETFRSEHLFRRSDLSHQ